MNKRPKGRKKCAQGPNPTREEIDRMTAETRATWDKVTERRRKVQNEPPWTPPQVEVLMTDNAPPDCLAWPI